MRTIVILVWAFCNCALAHTPDTSYAQFKVTRNSLECKFTFDLFTLVKIAPKLDANRDHQVTVAELSSRTSDVFDYLRQYVKLEIDGIVADFGQIQPVEFPPDVGSTIPEKDYHAATSLVHFTFRKTLPNVLEDFWIQFGFFDDLGQRHTVISSIEQDGQKNEVLFRFNEPEYLFDTGYVVTPSSDSNTHAKQLSRSNTNTSLWHQLTSFFWLGVEHIFLGFDHILFLLSLLVICKFKELVKIVTSFTVAHTITLILASLEVVQLPGRLVETAIAATIVYVAIENFWIKETSHRWRLTFVFGLIHGFGFAGVLRELGLPRVGLIRSLVSFNVGVEAGQLMIVLVLFPLIVALTKWKHSEAARKVISGAIALCGIGWFVDRALGLGWMP